MSIACLGLYKLALSFITAHKSTNELLMFEMSAFHVSQCSIETGMGRQNFSKSRYYISVRNWLNGSPAVTCQQ